MKNELTVDFVQSQLPSRQRSWVDEQVVTEIQKLSENPEYGPEFLDTYVDCLNIVQKNNRYTHQRYVQAIKFFSLVEAGNSLTDAYIKVFPDRYADRTKNLPSDASPEERKSIMRGEASRYNASQLLADIRTATLIPVQLIHRHLLHEAILETATLMRGARSEMVRQKAAATLITELKPQEDQTIKVEVNDGSTSIIQELQKATQALAAAEYEAAHAGVPMREIAERKIIHEDDEAIEGDYTEIPEEEEYEKEEEYEEETLSAKKRAWTI